MKKISIIGIGRVGLPLSLAFAEEGFVVYGIDIDKGYIDKLKNKEMPFLEEGAYPLLTKHSGKNFIPTTDYSHLKDSDAIIITLGTPVDEHLNPDYSQLESVIPYIIKNLKKDQLVILRSTVSPGTTEFVKEHLELKTGFTTGKDYFLAFCPERIAEGKALEEIKKVPQIIGGITPACSEKAEILFSNITEKCLVSDAKSAELAKIFTNMYRYINFAIANEFAVLATENNRNIYDIIDLVNKDYVRGGLAKPGFTAGPCLYKDGFFLLNKIPFDELIAVSWRINENLPNYLINKIKEITEIKNKKVAILGMAFKKNIDDTRNSLSFKLKKAFARENSNVYLHDPLIKEFNTDLKMCIKDSDIVVIATNHDAYSHLDKKTIEKLSGKKTIVCDLWNMTGEKKIIYSIK